VQLPQLAPEGAVLNQMVLRLAEHGRRALRVGQAFGKGLDSKAGGERGCELQPAQGLVGDRRRRERAVAREVDGRAQCSRIKVAAQAQGEVIDPLQRVGRTPEGGVHGRIGGRASPGPPVEVSARVPNHDRALRVGERRELLAGLGDR
jgi:hypothetical protein